MHTGNDLVLVAALGSTETGTSIRLAWSKAPREHPRRSGSHRQPDQARSRSKGLPVVHRRRRQGSDQGDPRDLRQAYADPALSDSQGPQRDGAPAQAAARFGAQNAATSLGTRRRRQRNGCSAISRERRAGCRQHPRRLDEMLTVNRLGLPAQLRRSLACTNGMGTVRRVCRNVKR